MATPTPLSLRVITEHHSIRVLEHGHRTRFYHPTFFVHVGSLVKALRLHKVIGRHCRFGVEAFRAEGRADTKVIGRSAQGIRKVAPNTQGYSLYERYRFSVLRWPCLGPPSTGASGAPRQTERSASGLRPDALHKTALASPPGPSTPRTPPPLSWRRACPRAIHKTPRVKQPTVLSKVALPRIGMGAKTPSVTSPGAHWDKRKDSRTNSCVELGVKTAAHVLCHGLAGCNVHRAPNGAQCVQGSAHARGLVTLLPTSSLLYS